MNRIYPLQNKERNVDDYILVIQTKTGQPFYAKVISKILQFDVYGKPVYGYQLYLPEIDTYCYGQNWEIVATLDR